MSNNAGSNGTTPPGMTAGQTLKHLRRRIDLKQRLPLWGLRLVFGLMLMILSELVMWQNPTAHSLLDWPILLILYVALASILIDLLVRFQAHDIPGLLLVSGIYALVSSIIISHSAFDNPPYSVVIRSLGLQTAACIYGIFLYVTVMRGKDVQPLPVAAATLIGALWGVWVHWYPIQPNIHWSDTAVPLQSAMLYLLPPMILLGLIIYFVAPRFRFFREEQMALKWWEAILAGLPLFIALLVGMVQNTIPFQWLIFGFAIGGFCVYVLTNRQRGYEPSILAEVMFPVPNPATYIILCMAFIVAGTLAYNLIDGPDASVGAAVYWLIFAFGSAWLPIIAIFVLWRAFLRDVPLFKGRTARRKE